MKIKLLVDSYSNATGFKLIGKGIHDVSPERAKYLLATFPDWFQAVDQVTEQETPEQAEILDTDVEVNAEEAEVASAEDGVTEGAQEASTGDEQTQSAVGAETDEPEAAQEQPEPSAPTKPLSKMNKDELQALAAQIGVEVNGEEMTADKMRAAIKAAQETV